MTVVFKLGDSDVLPGYALICLQQRMDRVWRYMGTERNFKGPMSRNGAAALTGDGSLVSVLWTVVSWNWNIRECEMAAAELMARSTPGR